MRHYNSHRIGAAAATCLIITVAGCATSDSPASNAGVAPVVAGLAGTSANVAISDDLSWGDDDAHFVVTTTNYAAGVDDAGAAGSGSSDGTGASDGRSPSARASSDKFVAQTVIRIDGTTETLMILRRSLTFVVGDGLADLRAVVAGGPGAVIVFDSEGVAGPPGVRYVLGADTLTEIGAGVVLDDQIAAVDGVDSVADDILPG